MIEIKRKPKQAPGGGDHLKLAQSDSPATGGGTLNTAEPGNASAAAGDKQTHFSTTAAGVLRADQRDGGAAALGERSAQPTAPAGTSEPIKKESGEPASNPGGKVNHSLWDRMKPRYQSEFRVAFDLLQRYTLKPPASPDDFIGIAAECNGLCEKYQSTLLTGLLCGVLDEVEKIYMDSQKAI